jgi:transcriptional regulator with XRE-family HTH domain
VPKRSSVFSHDASLKKRFGAAVRRYRQRLAISQEELAWRADMHRTYLADVERGARNLSLSSMARLVTGIGVSLSQFFATLESIELAPAGHPTRVSASVTRAHKTAALARAGRRKR